jgi:hypothetical protein
MFAGMATLAVRALPVMAQPAAKSFVAGAADDLVLTPAPIDPSWIMAGAPVARVAEHSRGQDDAAVTAVWDCTAGEFNWHFGWDETVLIIEGEVHVTAEDGVERLLRAGDVAYFAGGTCARWRVDRYVRKVAFCRKPFPKPLMLAYRLRDAVRSGAVSGIAA